MEGTGRSRVGSTGDSETDKKLPPSFVQKEVLVCQHSMPLENSLPHSIETYGPKPPKLYTIRLPKAL